MVKTMSKFINAFILLFKEGPSGVIRVVKYYYTEYKRRKFLIKQARPFHLISNEERKAQIAYNFNDDIKFSILTPLYNTKDTYLEDLIQSLEKQTYKNWELCLADGSSKEYGYVKEICKKWSTKDSRIRYCVLDANKGISENTNACMKIASGDYFGLLDHDDVLHESALFEMCKAIEAQGADFLYSDEAKFTKNIKDVTNFTFKSGFGKDELRSHNYICHFTVFSRKLMEKLHEGFRSEFDGSQDHDLVLRLTECADKIVHIPKVLYYWRVHPGSVSMDLDTKSYAVDSAIHAIKDQLQREGENGKVASSLPFRTLYRITYDIPLKKKVSILVHHFDDCEEFETIKRKILINTKYKNLEILPVDMIQFGFGQAGNKAAGKAKGDYLLFFNAECIPQNGEWIEEMMMFAQRKDVCAVGNKVIYKNGNICHAGIVLDNSRNEKVRFLCENQSGLEQGYEAMLCHVRNVTAVWDGCCMMSKERFFELDGFNEEMPGYEMIDFCLRGLEQNYWNVWTNYSMVTLNGYRTGMDENIEGEQAFGKRWKSKLESDDPYCHEILRMLNLI